LIKKMNYFYRLRGVAMLLTVLMLDPGTLLYAKARKGDKLYKIAEQAEEAKDYEKALDYYGQALAEDPGDAGYNLGVRRMRFQVSLIHIAAAKKLRDQGQIEESLHEFEKAFAIDPSNALAIQEIQRTAEMIKRNKQGNVKPEEANLTPSEQARKHEMDRMATIQSVPALRPITNRIETLKMNNQPPKVLYETVGKYAGINVIFDPQMQPMGAGGKNVNVDINNSSVEEALDYIALLTKTFWKPVTANAIFVTEDSVTKRRDYEDNVVKVFYLRNITSVQEFQEIVTAVRSITDIRRMFTYNAQNAVMARGTPDQIALAEKLFHDLDKPKSEVVVDVIVMQANSDRTRTLAASITGGGIQLPVAFTPRTILQQTTVTTPTTTTTTPTSTTSPSTPISPPTTTTTTTQGSSINLSSIGKVNFNDFSISLPGALLQAIASDSTTRILQSPQVRASDGQKVTLKIGQKVPYATGSFQPGFAGSVGGVSPLVSTQFNFAEVGVNVDITPHVHGTDEVTLHIAVEISSVASQVNIGGLQQPVIAQNKEEAEIRLREGEVSLLGGLTQLQDTKTLAGIPGLINMPILGTLLGGSKATEKVRSELMIALIPHIVRSPSITALDLRGVYAGQDQVVKLNYAQESAPTAPPVIPAPPAATVPLKATPPATAATSPVPSGQPVVAFAPGTANVSLGGQMVATLNAQNVTDLFSAAPIRLKWDPNLLRLNQISPGDFLKQDGQNPPVIDIRNDNGEATINVSRITGAPGANGSGVLAQLTFSAIGKGSGTVTVTEAALKDTKQQPIAASVSSLTFTVQ
jgi:general secretion pathway protein D